MFFTAVFVTALFSVIFYAHRKEITRSFYKLPSVALLGSGAEGAIREITNKEAMPHVKEEDFYVGYHTNGETLQLVAPRNHNMKSGAVLRKMKGMNCKSLVYVFDVSPHSEPIEEQIKAFNKSQNALSGADYIVVANNAHEPDKGKLKKIRNMFEDVHEVSLSSRKGLDRLRASILSTARNA